MIVKHTIAPVYDRHSRVLILGSFPSVRSRADGFFYGHPQNRFCRVIAAVLGVPVPGTTEEKKAMLLENRIALWDVIASCEISGSSDGSIRNARANDLSPILGAARIRRIFTNGGTAARLYKKLIEPNTGISAVSLPSTSPANARYTADMLIKAYGAVLLSGEEDD